MEKTCSGQYIDGEAPSLHLGSCTLNDPWIQFSSEFHQCLIEMQNPNLMYARHCCVTVLYVWSKCTICERF